MVDSPRGRKAAIIDAVVQSFASAVDPNIVLIEGDARPQVLAGGAVNPDDEAAPLGAQAMAAPKPAPPPVKKRPVAAPGPVTAGGTREPIDPVRYIGNNSSGKMGYALAEAARDQDDRAREVPRTEVPDGVARAAPGHQHQRRDGQENIERAFFELFAELF